MERIENYKNCLSSKHELGIHFGDSIRSDEFTLYDFDKDGDLDIVAIQKILPVFKKSRNSQRSSYIKFTKILAQKNLKTFLIQYFHKIIFIKFGQEVIEFLMQFTSGMYRVME